PEGLIELRAFEAKKKGKPAARAFLKQTEEHRFHQFVNDNMHLDLFFGQAARRDASSGEAANCLLVNSLWVDIDFKLMKQPGPFKEVVRECIFAGYAHGLIPSVVKLTGGGLHFNFL